MQKTQTKQSTTKSKQPVVRRRKKPAEAARTHAGEDAERESSAAREPARGESEPEEVAAAAVSHIEELRPDADADAEAEAIDGEEEEAAADDALPPTAAPTSRAQLKRALESLIFVSDQIITAQQLARIVKVKLAEVREMLAELSVDYEGRGIELVEVSGGYQFRSAAACAPFVRDLVADRPARLTRAQLETLALIAYRQPITRPEIDDVRGVDSGSAVKVLCERDLVKILGRKDEAGRPLLYGTTPFFLEFFGMNSMHELPTLREFTELTAEHRELFKRKTGEVPDLSEEARAASQAEAGSDDQSADAELDAVFAPEGETATPADIAAADAEAPLASDDSGDSAEVSATHTADSVAAAAGEDALDGEEIEREAVWSAEDAADGEAKSVE